jgi:E3 ubiquitin-protein ligase makorin
MPKRSKQKKRRLELSEDNKDVSSLNVTQSQDKVCGVCLETVWEKAMASSQRFGLLPNCSHIFCLNCIRSWQKTGTLGKKVVRSCPQCRIHSDFVFPSTNWIESKEEKEKLIMEYKQTLRTKPCRYFKRGRRKCPFGKKCFYLYAVDKKKIMRKVPLELCKNKYVFP